MQFLHLSRLWNARCQPPLVLIKGHLRCTIVTPTTRKIINPSEPGIIPSLSSIFIHSFVQISRLIYHPSSVRKKTVNSYASSTPCSVDHAEFKLPRQQHRSVCSLRKEKRKRGMSKNKLFTSSSSFDVKKASNRCVKGIHPYIQRSRRIKKKAVNEEK